MAHLFALVFMLSALSCPGQSGQGTVIVFRNTGFVKSALPCQFRAGDAGTIALPNRSARAISVAGGRQRMSISLEGGHKDFTFQVPLEDSLFLAVEFSSGPGGILPSSGIKPYLRIASRNEARAWMRQKWARRGLVEH